MADKKQTVKPTLPAVTLRSEEAAARQEAARKMGKATSPAKRAAGRRNGKKGGRPVGSKNSPAVRAKMRESQRKRRKREQKSPLNPTQTQD